MGPFWVYMGSGAWTVKKEIPVECFQTRINKGVRGHPMVSRTETKMEIRGKWEPLGTRGTVLV